VRKIVIILYKIV